ncbi:hypothetical protein ACIGLI_15730 [Bacillus subtilis]|uniref:hypothetical protein n=1 Tax=Bacillus TaxID=1386 RepID=UPI000D0DD131|nr:hypothetical protein [Bacillus subtilis]MBJ3768145.1 hypothetical protein [Bacillus subtilis]MDI6686125.1 hypothetical protein [Bacillus subtilis]MED4459730.1 hypothetical protein [Bacillus subtilis]PSL97302.1 hypothetical protein C7T97_20560 [Bacillus subtilis]RMD53275.1 hypothetical protein D3Z89_19195 [Bacillus subtilis]
MNNKNNSTPAATEVEKKIKKIELEIINLGKRVVQLKSTRKFPQWLYFKIGISILEGKPYDHEFWTSRLENSDKFISDL